MEHTWKLYILRCRDGSLYTGITTDLEKRVATHNSGKGAKYTRGRCPLELVYSENCPDHSRGVETGDRNQVADTRGKIEIDRKMTSLIDCPSLCGQHKKDPM